MSLKSFLVDAKRITEHFWVWDLMPIFGKDVPSNWIVAKMYNKYVLLKRFIPVVGYLPSSAEIDEKHFRTYHSVSLKKHCYSARLRWSKAIHAYVYLDYDTQAELANYIDLSGTPLSMFSAPPKNIEKNRVFSTYEEANLNAVLQGLTDDVLPYEDFSDSSIIGFTNCDIDFATMYTVEV